MDNLRIVCNISPWKCHVFDLWPKQISFSHPCIYTAIYNLMFTNISDPCQKRIIDCPPPDARTAILTLRRHCAPLTQDYVECTNDALLLHQKTRTPRSCIIILELHLNANAQLLSRRNPKHQLQNNQMSHTWQQQSQLLCRILPTI